MKNNYNYDLRSVRKRKGISQVFLARAIECRPATITEIEAGKMLPMPLTRRCSEQCLGHKIDWVSTFVGSDPEKLAVVNKVKDFIDFGGIGDPLSRIYQARAILSLYRDQIDNKNSYYDTAE